jgi:hypothetical protein
MKKIIKYSIKTFSEYPGPRFIQQGANSGEEFFSKILDDLFNKTIEENAVLEINLDGTAGYASSFLDEAFGRLVNKYSSEKVNKHIKLISVNEPDWIDLIINQTFLEWEKKRISKK